MKRLIIPALILPLAIMLLSLSTALAARGQSAPAATATSTPITNAIALQVQASDDDTSVRLGSGENRNDWVWIRLGTSANKTRYVNGFRFTNLAIPPGARIIQAKLVLYKSEWHTDFPIKLDVRAEATDSAQSFSDANPLASERILTVASTKWNIAAPPPNYAWFESPELVEVVQEVVSRPGWQSHNDLAIIITSEVENPSRHYLDLQSYDFDPSRAPRLEIVYETNVAIPTSTPTVTPTPIATPTPEPGRLAIEQAQALSCNARLSGDTGAWDNNVIAYTACKPAWPETGPEAVYRLDLPYDDADLHLQAFSSDPAQDLDLFLLTSARPDDCLQGADASLLQKHLSAGTYYIAVDGYEGASGAFTLISHCDVHFGNGLFLPVIWR